LERKRKKGRPIKKTGSSGETEAKKKKVVKKETEARKKKVVKKKKNVDL